jgi:hypothetical protein
MTLNEMAVALAAEAVYLPDGAMSVVAAYTSDLLSDVMAHAPADCVLVTVQNHRNTVAVATLVNARAILVCHGREIPADMDAAARGESVAVLRTALNQFEASCRLGALLAR